MIKVAAKNKNVFICLLEEREILRLRRGDDDLRDTIQEYRQTIEKDSALERRFQIVMVEEPTREEAEAILFGLILSVIILYAFLKNWGTVLVAVVVIPVTVLITLVAMKLMGMTFNLMTLGGIASAIGLVI